MDPLTVTVTKEDAERFVICANALKGIADTMVEELAKVDREKVDRAIDSLLVSCRVPL